MEWLNQKREFNEGDLKLRCLKFHPECFKTSSAIETVRMWKDENKGPQLKHQCHESEAKYQKWVTDHCPAKTSDSRSPPTIIVAMHPRLRGRDPDSTEETNMGAMCLPCKQETFQQTVKDMYQHRSLFHFLVRASTAVFHSRFVDWEERPAWGKSIVYHCRSDTISPTQDRDDIAMSVTCFPDVSLTFAVIYGCTRQTRKVAMAYLNGIKSDATVWHPLLLPMMFVELERKRLFKVLDSDKTKLQQRILDLETKLRAEEEPERKTDLEAERKAMTREFDSTNIWIGASKLKNGLQSMKEQIASIVAHSKALSDRHFVKPVGDGVEDKHAKMREMGEIIDMKLNEMTREFDSKIRELDSLLGGMAMATQMEWNYYTRLDTQATIWIAEATQKDGSEMRTISTLGMIFLPGTFLASLFSMGFFNWQPDINQRVSPWIALYFGLAALMTAVTIWRWRSWKLSEDRKASWRMRAKLKSARSDESLSQFSGETKVEEV